MNDEYAKYFKIFSSVSKAIHSGESTREVIETIVSHITEVLKAKGCIYWVLDTENRQIETLISHGFTYRSLAAVSFDTLVTIFPDTRGRQMFIEDAKCDTRIPDLERLGKKRVGSVTGIHFAIAGRYAGLLAVYFTGCRRLGPREAELVSALGEQGAIALRKTLSVDDSMLDTLRQIVEGFVLALEAKDETTHGHSIKVAEYARLTASFMGLPATDIETIYHAGLLHDIGKIGMDDYLLARLGILSGREMDIVKKHPEIGARILRPLTFLNSIEPLVLYHHERFNGTGYPEGRRGEEIPLGARILGVCDAFDTMLSGRGQMARMSLDAAIEQLMAGANIQFDPAVVEALFQVIEENPSCTGLEQDRSRLVKLASKDIRSVACDNLFRSVMNAGFPTAF